ncbi:MAG TPA: ion channel, partial [Myxococcota bacterium]|nr:ion channel [Myxococcota bacterium]
MAGHLLRAGAAPPTAWRLLRTPVLALGAVIAVGVLGYVAIEGWTPLEALWMVGITLSTIGYGEIHPLSDVGRGFTLALIIVSLLVTGQAIAEISALLGEDGLVGTLRLRRALAELRAMRDHTIVIGYGRLGREVVADLLHHAMPVVVIDVQAPPGGVPDGVRMLLGDASHDAVL